MFWEAARTLPETKSAKRVSVAAVLPQQKLLAEAEASSAKAEQL